MNKIQLLLYCLAIHLSGWCQLNSVFTTNTGNWYFSNAYQAKLAKDLGASLAGQDGGVFNWRSIQNNINSSNYNWDYTDSVVRALQSQGLDLFATLRSVVPSNSVNSNACSSGYAASSIKYSWMPIGSDTIAWKNFVTAVVDRYDMNGINDMPGLISPVNKWRTETEWQIFWCSPFPKDSIATAMQFVQLVNMTYRTIKTQQPSSIVSFAGLDTRHDKVVFNDGYSADSTFCISTNCTSGVNVSRAQFNNPSAPVYLLPNKINMMYILRNALYDELDIHQYGKWKSIPDVIRWLHDSAGVTKPIDFLEGGGPFCDLCEISSNPSELVKWNSIYVVYYYITALANNLNRISWHISPEYQSFSASFGDMDLLDSTIINNQYVKRPSYFTYRFLAKYIFSNQLADSVIRINESNPNLYHYEIRPLGLNVVWSTNISDSIVLNGSGILSIWNIPTTAGDSTIDTSSFAIAANHVLLLDDRIPVFYSLNNPLGIHFQIASPPITVNIFPNPFSNSTTLEINNINTCNFELSIYDLPGKEVRNYKIESRKTEITKGNLSGGIYFYRLMDKKQIIFSGKLMIE